MDTNKLISYYISDYAHWIKSYDYWSSRYDETRPDRQGAFTKSELLERVKRAEKEAADAKANLEELLGCEIKSYL